MIQPEASRDPKEICILVVEDDVLVRLTIAEYLREAGFYVVEAGHADEALAYLRTGQAVDLLFSDVRMPGTLDGLALARLVQREFPETLLLLTSGHLMPDESDPGIPVLAKPYSLTKVETTIRAALLARADEDDALDAV